MEPTLNTLATSANELLQKAPQEASQMQSQVAALKKFSDDIQELSSLENSLTELYELGEINVGTFCENVMDKVKEHIKIDVTPSVNAPKLQVKTNKEQLERILLYLLKNAAFYTEQGRISLEFKKRGAHTHQFIVTDTGIGIPKESIKKIWDRFYKSDLSRGKDKKGTGLGLAIVKEIIQAHGENIDVVSTEGVGSHLARSLATIYIFAQCTKISVWTHLDVSGQRFLFLSILPFS